MKRHFLSYLAMVGFLLYLIGVPPSLAQQALVYNSLKPIAVSNQNSSRLIDLLDRLEGIYKTSFVYEKSLLKDKVITYQLSGNDRIEAVLNQVLPQANLRYRQLIGGGYVILPMEAGMPARSPSADLNKEFVKGRGPEAKTAFSGGIGGINPDGKNSTVDYERRSVSGTVADESGELLTGVNVLIKGTQQGTVTNAKGEFTIHFDDERVVLVFSFIGYVSREVSSSDANHLDIRLKADINSLDELVVVGYGAVKKSSLTAAVSRVENKNLDQIPAGRAETALVGRMAGVSIATNRSNPGAAPVIRIRGAGSISASNDPLVVIDGFPGGSLASVNMNDVESIEVLKDASSAAIYGSRGSGGVLIVTTKKGKSGKPQLNLNIYGGIATARGHDDWISGQEYYDYVKRYLNREYVWAGGDPSIPIWGDSRRPANYQVNPVAQTGTENWQNNMLKSAPIQNYNLSIKGGADFVNYYISGTLKDEQGTMLNTWYKNYALRANVHVKINKFINAGVMISPSYSKRRAGPTNFSELIKMPPFVSATANATGSYLRARDYWGTVVSGGLNPMAVVNGTKILSNTFSNIGEMFLNFQLMDDLSFRASVGGNIDYQINENHQSSFANSAGSTGSAADIRNVSLLNENVLTYSKTLGKSHELNGILGASYQKANSRTSAMSALAGSFSNNVIETLNNAVISSPTAYTTKSQWGLISYFGRVNYSYKNKYLLSASFRTDASSRFGSKSRWGNFPSGSVAWRISEEKFVRDIHLISDLKIRASYGVTGNFNIGDFQYLGTIGEANYSPNNVLSKGMAQVSFGNDRLRWERTKSYDFGIELGLLKNRINLVFDYYSKRTDDLLYNVSIPAVTGFTNSISNVGDISNKGVELEINTRNLTGVFKWQTSLNFTRNKNKVISLGGVRDRINTDDYGMSWLLRIGEPMFSYYGYRAIGVLQDAEDVLKYPVMAGSKPGNTRYDDVNKDGKITPDDRVVLGNFQPKAFIGFINDFSYKNFDLSILMQASLGAKMYNFENEIYQGALAGAMRRSLVETQWWSKDEPGDGRMPGAALSNLTFQSNSDIYIENASFLAIRNINIGYTLPASLARRIGLNHARIYSSINNAWILTGKGFFGYNPEGYTGGEINGIGSKPGYNMGSEPINRVVSLGLILNL